MIDINKEYKTSNGEIVNILTTEGRDKKYPVIVEIHSSNGCWYPY